MLDAIRQHRTIFRILILFILTILVTLLSPVENVLGAKARLVYFHGAWVWVAIIGFSVAGIFGFVGLLSGREKIDDLSRAWGRTAMLFWLLFLPMSLVVMKINWNGFYFREPRWQIPLNLAVVGLLLQVGLSFLPVRWSSLGNLVFLVVFIFGLRDMDAVLHPESPIFSSNSRGIQVYFLGITLLLFLIFLQIVQYWHKR